MSIELNLNIAVLTPQFPEVFKIAEKIEVEVAKIFTDSSGQDISLKPTLSREELDLKFSGEISIGSLNSALRDVIGSQRHKTKVTKIGLLIADRLEKYNDYFGLMFDPDFLPGSNEAKWVPREGCAIFLGGIATKRSGADLVEEAIYTSIHELGHVFNLQHSNSPSYMARSADEPTPFVRSETAFDEHEKFLLSQCSKSRFIWPGGSRFGDLGDLGLGVVSPDGANAPQNLRLTIGIDRKEFWLFEPMELDIELSVEAGSPLSSVQVPDMLDPGFESFIIWIEEPNGERRRYRSPRHYCPHEKELTVSTTKPFRRDISIFGESGSFTFRKIGYHRISVMFATAPGLILSSNILEIQILPGVPGNAFFETARANFCDRNLSQLLYHRRLTSMRKRKSTRLESMCELYAAHSVIGTVHYALGRAFAVATREALMAGSPNIAFSRHAKLHLRHAVSDRNLGDHRRTHAENVLATL